MALAQRLGLTAARRVAAAPRMGRALSTAFAEPESEEYDMLRQTFSCAEEVTPKKRLNRAEYYAHDWHFGVPLGVWGGDCVCPDGRVYTAGDEGNLCGSMACHHGRMASCHPRISVQGKDH